MEPLWYYDQKNTRRGLSTPTPPSILFSFFFRFSDGWEVDGGTGLAAGRAAPLMRSVANFCVKTRHKSSTTWNRKGIWDQPGGKLSGAKTDPEGAGDVGNNSVV